MKWLDRRIAVPGPYLTLCLTEQEFKKALGHCGIKEPVAFVRSPSSHATTHICTNAKSELVCIVTLRDYKGRDPIEVAGLLLHEAVHVWQEYCKSIGETHPATEQEAYGIQAISQELMAEFVRLTKGKK
jgi:hypothetical protein